MKSQKGFAALEGVLILVIFAIIGFTGWFVYHARNTANQNLNSAANTSVAVKNQSTVNTECAYGLSVSPTTSSSQNLVLTNKSQKTCTLNGYPKVTLSGTNGQAVSQPASSDTTTKPGPVTVPPGGSAHATIAPEPGSSSSSSSSGSAPISKCSGPPHLISVKLPGGDQPVSATVSPNAIACPLGTVSPVEPGQ